MWTEILNKLKDETGMPEKMYNKTFLFLVNTNLDDRQKCEVVELMRDSFEHKKTCVTCG